MGKDLRPHRVIEQGFDQITLYSAGKPEGIVVNDISRFNRNSEARYRQDATIEISNNYPANHLVGTLKDGVYAGGVILKDSIVREATIVVLEPFDKPVKISVGLVDAPKKFVADFDATQDRGTIAVTKDCNTFITDEDVIVTVEGTDNGVAGRVAVVLEVSKLGTTTYMPSN